MQAIFQDIPNLFIYLDDFLIYNETIEEHRKTVKEVLQRLHENGMAISLNKCEWEQKQIDYLGYQISEKGLKPLPKKVQALVSLPPPQKQKRFIGVFGCSKLLETIPRRTK